MNIKSALVFLWTFCLFGDSYGSSIKDSIEEKLPASHTAISSVSSKGDGKGALIFEGVEKRETKNTSPISKKEGVFVSTIDDVKGLIVARLDFMGKLNLRGVNKKFCLFVSPRIPSLKLNYMNNPLLKGFFCTSRNTPVGFLAPNAEDVDTNYHERLKAFPNLTTLSLNCREGGLYKRKIGGVMEILYCAYIKFEKIFTCKGLNNLRELELLDIDWCDLYAILKYLKEKPIKRLSATSDDVYKDRYIEKISQCLGTLRSLKELDIIDSSSNPYKSKAKDAQVLFQKLSEIENGENPNHYERIRINGSQKLYFDRKYHPNVRAAAFIGLFKSGKSFNMSSCSDTFLKALKIEKGIHSKNREMYRNIIDLFSGRKKKEPQKGSA
jgi:hypothetical protein